VDEYVAKIFVTWLQEGARREQGEPREAEGGGEGGGSKEGARREQGEPREGEGERRKGRGRKGGGEEGGTVNLPMGSDKRGYQLTKSEREFYEGAKYGKKEPLGRYGPSNFQLKYVPRIEWMD
jgi:hypothetical protein